MDGPVGKAKELEDGLTLWGGRPDPESNSEMYLDLRFPLDRGVSSVWKDPRRLFERVAREVHFNRTVAGEEIPILSYGEPQESERWVDSHGRAWRFSFWRTRHDRASMVFACTPYPSSIFCGMYQLVSHTEPYFRSYLKEYLGRVARLDHAGSPLQWRDYLALGDEWVPRAVAEAGVDLGQDGTDRTVSVSVRGRTLRFKGGYGEKTLLSMDIVWEPSDPGRMEIRSVTWNERFKNKLLASSYAVYFKPVEGTSQGYNEYFKKVFSDEGRFNGKPQSEEGLELVAHSPDGPAAPGGADHLWGAQCSVGSGIDLAVGRKFMQECLSLQGFKRPSQGRVPASVSGPEK